MGDLIRLEKKRMIRDRRKKLQEEALREQESQVDTTDNSKKKGKKGRPTAVEPASDRRSVAGRLNEMERLNQSEDASVNNSAGSSNDNKKKKTKRRDSAEMSSIVETCDLSVSEKILQNRFQNARESEPVIEFVAKHWNRRELTLIRPLPGEQVEVEGKAEKGKEKKGKKDSKKSAEEIEKEEAELKEQLEQLLALEEVGIPLHIRDNSDFEPQLNEFTRFLPEKEIILEGLGLGPNGPPVPGPAEFSVVPYPNKRDVPVHSTGRKHFEFIATGLDDPNLAEEDMPDLNVNENEMIVEEKAEKEAPASAKKK